MTLVIRWKEMSHKHVTFADWDHIGAYMVRIHTGDPTKLGLGMFSIMFDVFFMTQHYILYPRRNHPPPEKGYVLLHHSGVIVGQPNVVE